MSHTNSLTNHHKASEKKEINSKPSLDISSTIWSRREKHKNKHHPFVCVLDKATEESKEITEESLIIKDGDTNLTTPQICMLHIDKYVKSLLDTPRRRYRGVLLTPSLTHVITQKKAAQALSPLSIIGNPLEIKLSKSPKNITPQHIACNKKVTPSTLSTLSTLSTANTNISSVHNNKLALDTPAPENSEKCYKPRTKRFCCNIFKLKFKKHTKKSEKDKALVI